PILLPPPAASVSIRTRVPGTSGLSRQRGASLTSALLSSVPSQGQENQLDHRVDRASTLSPVCIGKRYSRLSHFADCCSNCHQNQVLSFALRFSTIPPRVCQPNTFLLIDW